MMNPIRELRRELKLSQLGLAMRLGVGCTTVTKAENGYLAAIPEPMLQGLAAAGYDADSLQERYREWRAGRVREMAVMAG